MKQLLFAMSLIAVLFTGCGKDEGGTVTPEPPITKPGSSTGTTSVGSTTPTAANASERRLRKALQAFLKEDMTGYPSDYTLEDTTKALFSYEPNPVLKPNDPYKTLSNTEMDWLSALLEAGKVKRLAYKYPDEPDSRICYYPDELRNGHRFKLVISKDLGVWAYWYTPDPKNEFFKYSTNGTDGVVADKPITDPEILKKFPLWNVGLYDYTYANWLVVGRRTK